MADRIRETDLYPPVKAFLERQGYEVKAEVKGCDVVAVRRSDGAEEAPVIVELKTSFGLPLILQGVRRLSMSETVYLAFPAGKAGGVAWKERRRDAMALCRRLGLGLLLVSVNGRSAGMVEPALDPGPYQPRLQTKRTGVLLREFERRKGDPNLGGSSKRPVMTAYRQDALRCARFLEAAGQARPAEIKREAGVEEAGRILLSDVYAWFQRVDRGVYELSENGRKALATWKDEVERL